MPATTSVLDALVIAGCLSGERGDPGVAALVDELASAVGADTVVRARTGGRPMGPSLSDVLADLRRRGARRVLVATTHVVDGRLQHDAAAAVGAAASGFDSLRLVPPLLADAVDHAAVAAALDGAVPALPGRLVAFAGHRGPECEATFAQLERALLQRGRDDVLVGPPERLRARFRERPGRAVLLAPLLMSLGHHARHDVLDDLARDLTAQTWPHPLAELPAIRALVVAHARKELS